MSGTIYLAKDNETIQVHTNLLLSEYERFRKLYGDFLTEKEFLILKIVCIYHDIGKVNRCFQIKIRKKIHIDNEIPHGYISCAFIDVESDDFLNFNDDDIRVIYESIFYHHYRGEVDINMRNRIKKYIKDDLLEDSKYFNYEILDIPKKFNMGYIKSIKKRILHDKNLSKELEQKYVKIKGLLNRLDYAASAHIPVEIESDDLVSLVYDSIPNFCANDMQKFMLKNTDNNIIVIASTGMGKTEGSLLWIGKTKGFFTLPLKVSINAIFDRIINSIGYSKNKVGILHSDTISEYIKRDLYSSEYVSSTKQLTLPLTVCTVDQLITFIFKFNNFEVFLATLSYSKIVIDEIQTYSPDMIAYLLIALREIDRFNGKFAIVTATFPPIFSYFMDYIGLDNYVKPEEEFLISTKRHKMKVLEKKLTCEDIINCYNNNRVLVIVNTVKKAQELYIELSKNKDIEVNLFHSRFTKEDRAEKEKSIFVDGNKTSSKKVIWITTQVVEASLDIDFDILLTELSDINGLFQRMGRCFRRRALINNDCNIYVFTEVSGVRENAKSVIDYDIYSHSKEAILKYDNQIITEELKMQIVKEVYSVDNLKNSNYFKKIKDTINVFNDVKAFDLENSQVRLRDISSVTVIPRSLYSSELIENVTLFNKEKDIKKKLIIKDKILCKTVNVDSYFVDNKTDFFMLDEFEKIYIVDNKYNYDIGLSTEKDLDLDLDLNYKFI